MTIDLERIKQAIPIETLIGQTYTVVGSGDLLRTKEHDSLTIRRSTNSWMWYSQVNADGKTLGGSTIDWVMHRDNCTLRKAIHILAKMLDGESVNRPKKHVSLPCQAIEEWKSHHWQHARSRELEAAQEQLSDPNNPQGELARAYLAERQIRPDMSVAFGLGVADGWNPKAKKMMPALWIPWMNRSITAIQYRFINVAKDDPNAARFGQCKGGKRYLFGLQHCLAEATTEPRTLILVEGELNAISIFQAVYGVHACDVVSFGPQSNIMRSDVAAIVGTVAKRYQRVILWADEADIAKAALRCMPIGTTAVKSPHGLDANALLCNGWLDDLLWRLIREGQNK